MSVSVLVVVVRTVTPEAVKVSVPVVDKRVCVVKLRPSQQDSEVISGEVLTRWPSLSQW